MLHYLSRFMLPECQFPINDCVVEKGTSATPVREDKVGTKENPPASIKLDAQYSKRLVISKGDRTAVRLIDSRDHDLEQAFLRI